MILEYLWEDFLLQEELKTAFLERYRERMAAPVMPSKIVSIRRFRMETK
jgi:hypothetical protein